VKVSNSSQSYCFRRNPNGSLGTKRKCISLPKSRPVRECIATTAESPRRAGRRGPQWLQTRPVYRIVTLSQHGDVLSETRSA
jgi:hypothetical protein